MATFFQPMLGDMLDNMFQSLFLIVSLGDYPTVEEAIADNETNVLDDPSFDNAGAWDIQADWSVAFGDAVKVVPGTTNVQQTLSPLVTATNAIAVIDVGVAIVSTMNSRVQGGANALAWDTSVTGLQYRNAVVGVTGTTRIRSTTATSTGTFKSFNVFPVDTTIGRQFFNTTTVRDEIIQSDGTSIAA